MEIRDGSGPGRMIQLVLNHEFKTVCHKKSLLLSKDKPIISEKEQETKTSYVGIEKKAHIERLVACISCL